MKYLVGLNFPRQPIEYFTEKTNHNQLFLIIPQTITNLINGLIFQKPNLYIILPRFVRSFVKVIQMDEATMFCLFAKAGLDIYVSDDSSMHLTEQHVEERMDNYYDYPANSYIDLEL